MRPIDITCSTGFALEKIDKVCGAVGLTVCEDCARRLGRKLFVTWVRPFSSMDDLKRRFPNQKGIGGASGGRGFEPAGEPAGISSPQRFVAGGKDGAIGGSFI